MRSFLLFVLLANVTTSSALANSGDTLSELQNLLTAKGPRAVVTKIALEPVVESAVANGIYRVEDGWLRLTDDLILHSDADVTEGFDIALGIALGVNPGKVFDLMPNLVRTDSRLKAACESLPVCEDSSCAPDSMNFAKRRADAVGRLYQTTLSPKVQLCKNAAEKVVGRLESHKVGSPNAE